MWLARSNEWTTLRESVMIGSLEFHGWCTCTNHFQPPQWTSLTVTGELYAFRPFHQKNNKKISKSPEIASNEVEITLEKYAFIEPDGEHYCRKTVFWCKYGHTKIPMFFTIINILSIGKNIVSELNIALHVKHCLTARLVRIFKIRIGSSILFFTGSHLIPCSWVYH